MKILLAYDGSDCADTAIDDLTRAGLPAQVELTVLTVADVWPRLPAESYQVLAENELGKLPLLSRRAHTLAASAMADAKELATKGAQRVSQLFQNWKVVGVAGAGSPPDAILKHAEESKT